MKMINRLLAFLRKVINNDSKESSKRVIAVWTMVLVSLTVIVALVRSTAFIAILTTLLGFIATLLGIATYQSVKQEKNNKENDDIN